MTAPPAFCSMTSSHLFAIDRTLIPLFDVNPKLSLPWQKGQSVVNFSDTVELPAFKNPLFGARFLTVYLI